jgi:hypothetical protein
MIPPRSIRRRSALLALLAAQACSGDTPAVGAGSAIDSEEPVPVSTSAPPPVTVAQQGDTSAALRPAGRVPPLTDEEQRVAELIVFAPSTADRFLVAARGKRLLVDLGRVDLDVKQKPERLALVRRVAARTGPLARVAQVRVSGTWGEETDSIVGYDVWNGRAVAVLAVPPRTDSLLQRNLPLVGVATRAARDGSVAPPPPVAGVAPCARDSVPPVLQARVAAVRDSLVRWVTDSLTPPYARLVKSTAVRGDATIGCFANWSAVVIVTSRTPSLEWNEERALLVGPTGAVASARLRDLRLRAHESLMAFDADGDGVDELAARGLAVRMGAQSVLKLDPATRRFSRYASGFAWESR